MTGLMKRILRRRAEDQSPPAGAASSSRGRARGERLPGYGRLRSFHLARLRGRLAWGAPAPPATVPTDPAPMTEEIPAPGLPAPSFQDRSRLRRRLRFLRRARELAFRDVGGLIFDMRRFGHNRPDLLDVKLDALLAVDQELRSLERVLGDRRAVHTLHEPGISACPRCSALHASESNFCPQCGLLISGPRAVGEVGGTMNAPPRPGAPTQQEWPWPSPSGDQPTAPTMMQPTSETVDQSAVSFPRASVEDYEWTPPVREPSADESPASAPVGDAAVTGAPAADDAADEELPSGDQPTRTNLPPRASDGS